MARYNYYEYETPKKCETSGGKYIYRSKADALEADAEQRRKFPERDKKSAYLEQKCGHWHLTSGRSGS